MRFNASLNASRRQEDITPKPAPPTQGTLPDPAPASVESSHRGPGSCEVSPSSAIDSSALDSSYPKSSRDSTLHEPFTADVKTAESALHKTMGGNDTPGEDKWARPGRGGHDGGNSEDEGRQSQSKSQSDVSKSPCSAPDSVPSLTWCQSGEGPPARQLLRKLRWATLGPAYDWTRREYSSAASSPVLPAYLRELAIRLAASASGALGEARVVRSSTESGGNIGSDGLEGSWRPFEPDAALVNYYQSDGDTLCGHKVCPPCNTLAVAIQPCRHSTLHKQVRTSHFLAAQCSALISCVTSFRMLDLRESTVQNRLCHARRHTRHTGARRSIPTLWNVSPQK